MFAVLLAAGGSSRFAKGSGGVTGDGAHKLLAPFGATSVAGAAAAALAGAVGSGMVIVLGARADEVRRVLGDGRFGTVRNPEWAEGMGGSIALGVRAAVRAARRDVGRLGTGQSEADPGAEPAVLLALADMPLLRSEDHLSVIRAHDFDDPRAVTRGVADVADAHPGHPVLFGPAWTKALASLGGDEGAGRILRGTKVRTVPLPPDTQLDVDTPEALARARRAFEKRFAG